MKTRVLFICLGNICRSCTAEEIFRSQAAAAGRAERFDIDSAGLIDYHEGELPDERMRRAARRHGYELTHRSRPIRPEDFARFDLIVAMDESNRERLERMARSDAERQKIVMMARYLRHHPDHAVVPDPYYGGPEGFELVIALLEDACAALLEELGGK